MSKQEIQAAPDDETHGSLLVGQPVGQILLRLTWPMVVGTGATIVFNVVDIFFIGKLGVRELAAVGFVVPIIFLILSVSGGLSTGTAVVVSKAVGEGQMRLASRLAIGGLVLTFIGGSLFGCVGVLTLNVFLSLLGAEASLLPLIRQYQVVIYAGLPLVLVSAVGLSILKAYGDTLRPGFILFTSAIWNLILDPVLIFGYGPVPPMGMRGAAVATVISWLWGVVLVLVFFIRQKILIWQRPSVAGVVFTGRKIFYTGLSAFLAFVLNPIVLGVMTRLVSKYGEAEMAAFGVVMRIEQMVLIVFFALANVMVAFVGQNWGAGRIDRNRRALGLASKFIVLFGLGSAALLWGAGGWLAALFNRDAAYVATAVSYFSIVPSSYMFHGLLLISASSFFALQKPIYPPVLSALRLLGLYVPLAYILSSFLGIKGVFIGLFVANICSGGLARWLIHRTLSVMPDGSQT